MLSLNIQGKVQKQEKTPIENRIDTVLTDGGKLAIVMVAHSFRFGGNWAFIRNDATEYKDRLELLREEKPNVDARPLSNGALVLMDKGFLTNNVNAVIPGGIGKEFVDKANARKIEEQKKYSNFVESVLEGKSRFLVDKNSYKELTIGTYCVNETNLIKVNGVEYPSYKLPLEEMLNELRRVNVKYKRPILLKVVKDTGFGFMPIEAAMQNLKAVHKGLEIADSNTGVLLSLRLK